MSRRRSIRRLRCLLGHSWSYLVVPPTIAGWCTRCGAGATLPTAQVEGSSFKADAASTFQLLAQAIDGLSVDPGQADTATLIKIAVLLLAMHAPASPAAVLDVVAERLAAAEDTAAVRHLFDEQGRPL